eukprot:snap_masked-scaffold_2-processed-gene-14.10-mRNA-1 protein AED:1.00 eAED:1.00 QI:0/-1/0/0/-1/1/1/0/884
MTETKKSRISDATKEKVINFVNSMKNSTREFEEAHMRQLEFDKRDACFLEQTALEIISAEIDRYFETCYSNLMSKKTTSFSIPSIVPNLRLLRQEIQSKTEAAERSVKKTATLATTIKRKPKRKDNIDKKMIETLRRSTRKRKPVEKFVPGANKLELSLLPVKKAKKRTNAVVPQVRNAVVLKTDSVKVREVVKRIEKKQEAVMNDEDKYSLENIMKLTIPKIRIENKKRGLKIYGKKAFLAKLLFDYEQEKNENGKVETEVVKIQELPNISNSPEKSKKSLCNNFKDGKDSDKIEKQGEEAAKVAKLVETVEQNAFPDVQNREVEKILVDKPEDNKKKIEESDIGKGEIHVTPESSEVMLEQDEKVVASNSRLETLPEVEEGLALCQDSPCSKSERNVQKSLPVVPDSPVSPMSVESPVRNKEEKKSNTGQGRKTMDFMHLINSVEQNSCAQSVFTEASRSSNFDVIQLSQEKKSCKSSVVDVDDTMLLYTNAFEKSRINQAHTMDSPASKKFDGMTKEAEERLNRSSSKFYTIPGRSLQAFTSTPGKEALVKELQKKDLKPSSGLENTQISTPFSPALDENTYPPITPNTPFSAVRDSIVKPKKTSICLLSAKKLKVDVSALEQFKENEKLAAESIQMEESTLNKNWNETPASPKELSRDELLKQMQSKPLAARLVNVDLAAEEKKKDLTAKEAKSKKVNRIPAIERAKIARIKQEERERLRKERRERFQKEKDQKLQKSKLGKTGTALDRKVSLKKKFKLKAKRSFDEWESRSVSSFCSDEEEYPRKAYPAWCKTVNTVQYCKLHEFHPEELSSNEYPDLELIFDLQGRRYRERTSSAKWDKDEYKEKKREALNSNKLRLANTATSRSRNFLTSLFYKSDT